MIPARIAVDFVPQRRRLSLSGVLLLVLGLGAAFWVFDDFTTIATKSEVLDLSIARYASRNAEAVDALPIADEEEIALATRQLLTPWTELLADLELAAIDSGKNVALLEVAPDKNKRSIRVSGEARSLEHALAYVERLQAAASLTSPLLENHEIQTSSNERPVRFVVIADWRIDG